MVAKAVGRATGDRMLPPWLRVASATSSVCTFYGMKAPGGRPPRIPDWLRREVVEEAEKELAGVDLETILSAEPRFDEMSEAEKLADLDQLGVAMLLDLLRSAVGRQEPQQVGDLPRPKCRSGQRPSGRARRQAAEPAGRTDRRRGYVVIEPVTHRGFFPSPRRKPQQLAEKWVPNTD